MSATVIFPPAPTTRRGSPTQLSVSQKGQIFYTSGRCVVIRDLANPMLSSLYTQHTASVSAVAPSPSGYYVASADINGNVRIWDPNHEEQIIKTQTQVFSGRVNDICWDSESQRIAAVGDGKDKFGHVFMFDTASSVGEIAGHNKAINSVHIKPNRPFRIVTGSDDNTVNFYHGVPYKFEKSIKSHSRFVQAVRFSPSGELFVSAGMDGKLFLYDGKTGDQKVELSTASQSHTGGIFAVSWSPDGKSLLTASADSTVKLWDVHAQQVTSTFQFWETSPTLDDQQVGCVWHKDYLLSLSLNGDLNYLDKNQPSKPLKILKSHQKAITALTVTSEKTFFSGSYDGRVLSWDVSEPSGTSIGGTGHSNQVSGIVNFKDHIYSIGMDDTLRKLNIHKKTFEQATLATDGFPKALAAYHDWAVFGTVKNELVLTKNMQKVCTVKTSFTPTSICFSPKGNELAVGAEDNKVYFYSVSADGNLTLDAKQLSSNRGAVTCVSYSPNGQLLAVADTQRAIFVYDTSTNELKLNQWVFHSAKVNAMSWSSDSKYVVSGSLDTNIEVWSVDQPMKHQCIKGAHLESVNAVSFLSEKKIISAGQDGCIKIWNLN